MKPHNGRGYGKSRNSSGPSLRGTDAPPASGELPRTSPLRELGGGPSTGGAGGTSVERRGRDIRGRTSGKRPARPGYLSAASEGGGRRPRRSRFRRTDSSRCTPGRGRSSLRPPTSEPPVDGRTSGSNAPGSRCRWFPGRKCSCRSRPPSAGSPERSPRRPVGRPPSGDPGQRSSAEAP
jgi:hypothetical protein